MNPEEAKDILLLYRPETADAADAQIAEALELAKRDPVLKNWLAEHCARQLGLREKFRQIAAPPGLKEQIISEQAVQDKTIFWREKFVLAALAILVLLAMLAPFWFSHSRPDDTLAVYENRMVSVALRGYGMDLATDNEGKIRAHLAQNQAPADFILPAGLKQAVLTGCAVENWQRAKVSMICFHTGKTASPGDLWLFVVERASVKNAPAGNSPQFSKVNRLITATWTQGDKLYLLGLEGDEQVLRQYL